MRTQFLPFSLTPTNNIFAFDPGGDPFTLAHAAKSGDTYGTSGFILQDTGWRMDEWNAINPSSTFTVQASFDRVTAGAAASLWAQSSLAGPGGGGIYGAIAADFGFKCYSPLNRARLFAISTASISISGVVAIFRGGNF